MPAITFENVDIVFGDKPHTAIPLIDQGLGREEISEKTGQILGVANASLEVNHGEICVLMGLSGSGKSTLLRAVNGLNQVVRGRVLLEDKDQTIDVANCTNKTLRNLRMTKVAMVFQQFALLPWRTVKENVALGLELQGIKAKELEHRVMDKLKMVGLDTWADKYAHELSGGMQQRVGLARAFVTNAEILLMDEPFSALDPLIRDRLQDELLELQVSLNKTIIFVSHDLDEALKIGNRIAIMEGGRIVQYAQPEQIVLNPVNQYVADFVAHMNPLNVLRGLTLMTSSDQFKRHAEKVLLDSDQGISIQLDKHGQPVCADKNDTPLLLTDSDSILSNPESIRPRTLAMANIDKKMRDIIKLRHLTGMPVIMLDERKFVGVISDNEIYQGILQQTDIAHSQL